MTNFQQGNFYERFRHHLPTSCATALIFALSILAYANSFPGTFIQDDHTILQNNPLIRDFSLVELLCTEYWHGSANDGLYRPLTMISFALNQHLLGNDPWGYHLVNVLLHATVAVLLWKMLRRWGFSPVPSWLAAAIFTVHPIHTEAVNQAVGRSELLAALFMLTGLIVAKGQGRWRPMLVCVSFACALLSKEHAITMVAILPLMELFNGKSLRIWRQRWRLYVALVLIAAAWLAWREFGVVHPLAPDVPSRVAAYLAYEPWPTRILTALELQWFYVAKLLLPIKLQAAYAKTDLPATINNILSLSGLIVTASVIFLGVKVAVGWRRWSPLALFVSLYLVAFAPTANLFVPINVTFAERLTYWPSIWFCSAIALFIGDNEASKHALQKVLVGGYILVLIWLCLGRNPDFATEQRYWSADLKDNPGDVLSLAGYASLQLNNREYKAAEATLAHILQQEPEFPYVLQMQARALIDQERYREALLPANKFLKLAREENDQTGMGYGMEDIGRIYLGTEDYANALYWLEQSSVKLNNPEALLNLRGTALAGLGKDAEALAIFRQLASQEGLPDSRYPFALALLKTGRLNDARSQLQQVPPDKRDAATWNLQGVVESQLGNWFAAEAAFARAAHSEPGNGYYRDNLLRARQNMLTR